MRGLLGIGQMQYRPLTPRIFSDPRPAHEPQSHVASPYIRGGSSTLRLRRGDEPRSSGFRRDDRDRDAGRFEQPRSFRSFDRDHDYGRFERQSSYRGFDHDRFFDFGRYDRFRDLNRFDFYSFARYHRYGFFRYRCPVIVPYQTFIYPNEFLFGPWFGVNTCWWYGNVVPSAGVTVVLIF